MPRSTAPGTGAGAGGTRAGRQSSRRRRRPGGRGGLRRSDPAAGGLPAGRGGGAALAGRIAEVVAGQPGDGGQGLAGLRSPGAHQQLVAAARAQRGDGVQAAGAHRPARGGQVLDGDVGVERGRRAHQPGRRPGVQPQPVGHHHAQDQGADRRARVVGRGRESRALSQARARSREPAAAASAGASWADLCRQAAARLGGDASRGSRRAPPPRRRPRLPRPGARRRAARRRGARRAAGRAPARPTARRCPGP